MQGASMDLLLWFTDHLGQSTIRTVWDHTPEIQVKMSCSQGDVEWTRPQREAALTCYTPPSDP